MRVNFMFTIDIRVESSQRVEVSRNEHAWRTRLWPRFLARPLSSCSVLPSSSFIDPRVHMLSLGFFPSWAHFRSSHSHTIASRPKSWAYIGHEGIRRLTKRFLFRLRALFSPPSIATSTHIPTYRAKRPPRGQHPHNQHDNPAGSCRRVRNVSLEALQKAFISRIPASPNPTPLFTSCTSAHTLKSLPWFQRRQTLLLYRFERYLKFDSWLLARSAWLHSNLIPHLASPHPHADSYGRMPSSFGGLYLSRATFSQEPLTFKNFHRHANRGDSAQKHVGLLCLCI